MRIHDVTPRRRHYRQARPRKKRSPECNAYPRTIILLWEEKATGRRGHHSSHGGSPLQDPGKSTQRPRVWGCVRRGNRRRQSCQTFHSSMLGNTQRAASNELECLFAEGQRSLAPLDRVCVGWVSSVRRLDQRFGPKGSSLVWDGRMIPVPR